MAFAEYDIWSAVLGRHCSFKAFVPQLAPYKPENNRGRIASRREYPMLILLHGLGENANAWRRGCAIERLAAEARMVVIMPEGGRSFYTRMKYGEDHWRFVADELPEICRQLFPVSGRREETFAAGISMGGYGALKLGLRAGERFSRVAGVSSFVDVVGHLSCPVDFISAEELSGIFGDVSEQQGRKNDLFALASQAVERGKPVAEIGIFCGRNDFLYRENLAFYDHLQGIGGVPCRGEFAEGAHNWDYWCNTLPQVLKFLTGR